MYKWICAGLLLLLALPLSAQPVPSSVRVRILEHAAPRAAALSADAPVAITVDGRSVGTLNRGESAQITRNGSQVQVHWAGARHRGHTVDFRAATPLRVAVTQGRRQESRSYHGAMRVSENGGELLLVNTVPMVDYIASVVASEYPFKELEGVKAQAVVARTYVVYQMAKPARVPYDVVDNASAQMYKGAGAETATSRRAAQETTGEVLMHRGSPILAAFYSSSGGHTASNESIWTGGTPLAYLRARPDPYDGASPHNRWHYSVARERLLGVLSSAYGFTVTGWRIAERSAEGRVVSVRLEGRTSQTVSGNDFRLKVTRSLGIKSLRSTFFDADTRGGQYIFDGRGFGHGIGMSQYGARAQAQQGRSYHDILSFYYTDVTLKRTGTGRPAVADHTPRPTQATSAQATPTRTIATPSTPRFRTSTRTTTPSSSTSATTASSQRRGW